MARAAKEELGVLSLLFFVAGESAASAWSIAPGVQFSATLHSRHAPFVIVIVVVFVVPGIKNPGVGVGAARVPVHAAVFALPDVTPRDAPREL